MGLLDQIKANQTSALDEPKPTEVKLSVSDILKEEKGGGDNAKSGLTIATAQTQAPSGAPQPGQVEQPKPKFAFGGLKGNSEADTASISKPSVTTGSTIVIPKVEVQVAKVSATAVAPTKPNAINVADILTVEMNTFERGSDAYQAEEMSAIRSAIEMLRDNIKDAKIVGQSVKNIMLSMAEDPSLADQLQPEDIGLMVRGLRESHGVAIAKRHEGAAKRATKASKQQQADDAFADIDF